MGTGDALGAASTEGTARLLCRANGCVMGTKAEHAGAHAKRTRSRVRRPVDTTMPPPHLRSHIID
eukprot:13182-Eustigmatos_ZCMA.PRE.1